MIFCKKKKKKKERKHHTCVLPVKVSPWQFNLVKTLLHIMVAVFFPFISLDSIKSLRSSPHSDTHFPLPRSLHLHPTHTVFPLSQCSVHTSGFSIPATKPQQQGGNDPATTAVMMESVGGLAGSLTLPNKSPNNSVNIRADPATRSNTLTHGWAPHMTLGNLSVGQENCCWPAHCVHRGPRVHVQCESMDAGFGPQNAGNNCGNNKCHSKYFNPVKLDSFSNNTPCWWKPLESLLFLKKKKKKNTSQDCCWSSAFSDSHNVIKAFV